MTHWASKYVGTPYGEGARGPLFYDCWGIIQLIYRQEKGIELPELAGLRAPLSQLIHDTIVSEGADTTTWTIRERPVEGCVVALGSTTLFHHVGIWIDADGGRVLHCRNGQNTVTEGTRSLRLRGMKHLRFYQHTLWPG